MEGQVKELQEIERDVEVKKIEVNSDNTSPKLD